MIAKVSATIFSRTIKRSKQMTYGRIGISTAPTKFIPTKVTSHVRASINLFQFRFAQWTKLNVGFVWRPVFKVFLQFLLTSQSLMPFLATLETHDHLTFSTMDFLLWLTLANHHFSTARFNTPSSHRIRFIFLFFNKSITFIQRILIIFENLSNLVHGYFLSTVINGTV